MKLCAVGLRGIPDVMGGIETHCQNLYPELANAMDIVVLARSPYVEREVNYKGVRVVPVWALKNKYLETILHTFLAIFYARFVIRCDVIHIHAVGPSLLSPLARLSGMNVLITHHGADYNRAKWSRAAKRLLQLGEWLAVKYSNQMIVVGRSLTQALKNTYAPHRDHIHYVPNGAYLPESNRADLHILQEVDIRLGAGNYILYVGRLVPEKGVHDLIEAHNHAATGKYLVIVGDADHQDGYSIELKQKASDSVFFLGRRQGIQLAALFKYAHLFVLPSYHEGLPIVALEAISAGIPVLLSDIAPNTDIGLPAEHFFKVGDTHDLQCKLIQDWSGKQVDDSHLEAFSWSKIACQTLSIIQQAMRTGRSPESMQTALSERHKD